MCKMSPESHIGVSMVNGRNKYKLVLQAKEEYIGETWIHE